MKIVTDDNIPYLPDAIRDWGTVIAKPGKLITAEDVRNADLLFVRSRTRIDASLLEGSRVRFVGSAVIGLDHVDQDYLKEKDIGFASAQGSNSNSVAEYVCAALLTIAQRQDFRLAGKSIGIVGLGNVGSRVDAKARALGMNVLKCDPPLARSGYEGDFVSLDEIVDADIITFHVPLTRDGTDATYQMADAEFLTRLKRGAIVLNTARGGILDECTLKDLRSSSHLSAVVLDAWENEPAIDWELFNAIDLGSTHIAGHSLDGKINGTLMVYRAACDFLGVKADWDVETVKPPPIVPHLKLSSKDKHDEDVIHEAVSSVYDIQSDDERLRKIAAAPPETRNRLFEDDRRNYPIRREFQNTRIDLDDARPSLMSALAGLGFQIDQ